MSNSNLGDDHEIQLQFTDGSATGDVTLIYAASGVSLTIEDCGAVIPDIAGAADLFNSGTGSKTNYWSIELTVDTLVQKMVVKANGVIVHTKTLDDSGCPARWTPLFLGLTGFKVKSTDTASDKYNVGNLSKFSKMVRAEHDVLLCIN